MVIHDCTVVHIKKHMLRFLLSWLKSLFSQSSSKPRHITGSFALCFYLKHMKTAHINIWLIIFCSFLWILSNFLDTFVSNVCVPHSFVSILGFASFRFFVTVGSLDTLSMLSARSCIGPFLFQTNGNLVCLYLLWRKNTPIYFWNCHNASEFIHSKNNISMFLGIKAKLRRFSRDIGSWKQTSEWPWLASVDYQLSCPMSCLLHPNKKCHLPCMPALLLCKRKKRSRHCFSFR